MTSHILWENNPAMFETPEVVDHPKNLATEGPKRKSLELSTRSVFFIPLKHAQSAVTRALKKKEERASQSAQARKLPSGNLT